MSTAKTTSKRRTPPRTPRAAAPARPARLSKATLDALVDAAKRARRSAYAPYSNYHVGAAILTGSGKVFAGCNVENASFGGCICAERSAIVQMVAAGERDPVACAVVTGERVGAAPCGICRQVLSEFARDMTVVLVGVPPRGPENRRTVRFAKLLPLAFELNHSARSS